jgi:hypothetical protein
MTAKECVQQELAELEENLSKLKDFVKTENFYKLSLDNQDLLLYQEKIMISYIGILKDRLRIWQDQ